MAASSDRARPPDLVLNDYGSNFNERPHLESGNELGYTPHDLPDTPGSSSLPRGAMSPHTRNLHSVPEYQPLAPVRDSSPESSDHKHVQYAAYPPEKNRPWNHPQPLEAEELPFAQWTPLPLRPWFWITFATILVLGAVGLEVALHFSNKNHGWAVKNAFTATQGFMHYVYTFPSVVVGMIITSIWAWTDIEFKRMQPYIDLVHGDALPKTSLLLDYTRINNFIVWTRAARNKHYVVSLSSLMVVLTLCISPLSASMFTVRDTKFLDPPTTINTKGIIGLNQDETFRDLSAFVNAAGFASAAVLYNLDDPEFIFNGYTVAPFDMSTSAIDNGTIYANTSAILSEPNCQGPDVEVNMTKTVRLINGNSTEGWENTATFKGCNYTWWVDKRAKNLFGFEPFGSNDNTPSCGPLQGPAEFRPVVFWFFTYETTPPKSSIAFCEPKISLWDVSVEVNLATKKVQDVHQLRGFDASKGSNYSDASGNITGAPLEGRAYNGASFVLDENVTTDPFVIGRQNATLLQMPAAIFQAASISDLGRIGSFTAHSFVGLSTQSYRTYLALIAQTVYLVPTQRPMSVQIESVRKRLWLSDVAVHLLAVAMLVLAFIGTIVQLLHRADRRDLPLGLPPGTIASAVSVGGQTGVGAVLSGRQKEEDVQQALGNRRFRMDPRTMKIVMEGEQGYEDAASPDPRRRSVFGKLQMGIEPSSPAYASKRFSRMSTAPAPSSVPLSPRTPASAGHVPPRSAGV